MRLLNLLVMLTSVLLFSFPSFGQEMPNGNVENQQEPAIAVQWSEPVNGIRMMVKYLQRDTPTDEIHLLVLLQNSSEKPIAVPPLDSRHSVVFENAEEQDSNGNLQINVEQLGDRKDLIMRDKYDRLGRLDRAWTSVEPGGIRLHAICLHSPSGKMQMLRKENASAITTDSVVWPGLNDPNSKGRWRISLSWRPDEQFPVDEDAERQIVEVPEQWRGVQIDSPPLELEWEPQGEGAEHRED